MNVRNTSNYERFRQDRVASLSSRRTHARASCKRGHRDRVLSLPVPRRRELPLCCPIECRPHRRCKFKTTCRSSFVAASHVATRLSIHSSDVSFAVTHECTLYATLARFRSIFLLEARTDYSHVSAGGILLVINDKAVRHRFMSEPISSHYHNMAWARQSFYLKASHTDV